jgi:hypothetical protein
MFMVGLKVGLGKSLMPATIQEIYTQVLSTLSPTERLQLATLILNGLVQQDANVDESDSWTEQDQPDLAAFSWQYAMAAFPEDEKVIE